MIETIILLHMSYHIKLTEKQENFSEDIPLLFMLSFWLSHIFVIKTKLEPSY